MARERAANAAKREADSIQEQVKAFEQLDLQSKIDSLSTELSEFQQKCAKLEGQLNQYQKPEIK